MTKNLGILFVFILALGACTSKPKTTADLSNPLAYERSPTSIEDYEGVKDEQTIKDERSLKASFAAEKPALFEKSKADVKRRLNQILVRSAGAAALMNEFDAKLDTYFDANGNKIAGKNFELDNELVYRKLQRTRQLVESVEERVATVYAYIWKLYLNPQKQGVSGNRDKRVRERAKQMLEFIHSEVNQYMGDVRIIGLMRLRHHIDEIHFALMSDARADDPAFQGLNDIVARMAASDNDTSNFSYNDFINAMKGSRDSEYEKEMKPERIPQSNVLVNGFKNTTGSEFGSNKWVLTFDDGPHKDNTQAIAKVLKDQGIKGDYFWLSKLVKTYPSIAKEIYDGGYGIASHSVDHSNLPKLSGAKLTAQVSGSRDTIETELHNKGATDYKMKDFRCPYGACWAPKSKAVQQAIVDAGLRHVYWTVDTMDWQDKNTQSVLARTLKQMKASGRGIILFHDIHPVAAKVLPLLFKDKYVVDNNVQFLTL